MEAKTKKKASTYRAVPVSEEARYRVALIASLYKMKMGDVLDRAIVCYANVLRIGDKIQEQFPKEGIDTPPLTGTPRRPPTLPNFHGLEGVFKKIKGLPEEDQEETPS